MINYTTQSTLTKWVKGSVCYIDTLYIWFEQKPDLSWCEAIKSLCGYMNTQIPKDKKTNLRKTIRRNRTIYRYCFMLHQPSDDAIRLLESLNRLSSRVITKVDVAVDLITYTADQACILTRYLQQHTVKPWHGKQKVGFTEDGYGMYTMERKKGVNLAIYPRFGQLHNKTKQPMLSKVTSEPCAHFEIRVSGCRTVARILNAKAPIDLLSRKVCDLRKIIRRHFVLERANMQAIGRQRRGRNQAKKVEPIYGRIGDKDVLTAQMLLRGYVMRDGVLGEHYYVTLMFKDWLRQRSWCRVEKCFSKIKTTKFLQGLYIYGGKCPLPLKK